jgi:sn1-specific diacylglycerol lipase
VVAGVRAANRLSPLPSVDHARKSIVLAIRGTASLSDAITDICVAPEDVSKWIPADVKAKLPPGAPLLSHAGIVRAAEAVLADVDAMGVLPALLEGDRSLLCAFSQNLDAGKRDSLAKQASGVLREVATAAIDPARLAAVCDASLPDTKGWRLVVTGHSLGAGAASVLGLLLKPRYPGLRVWAFSPPGCMCSAPLIKYFRSFTTAVVAGKDAVPRSGTATLNRLVDEMVNSLGRCRYPKLQVLLGGWWRRAARPPPAKMFYEYANIPEEVEREVGGA